MGIEMGFRYKDHRNWVLVLYAVDSFCYFCLLVDTIWICFIYPEVSCLLKACTVLRALRLQALAKAMKKQKGKTGGVMDQAAAPIEVYTSVFRTLLWGMVSLTMLTVFSAIFFVSWARAKDDNYIRYREKVEGHDPLEEFSSIFNAAMTLFRVPFPDGSGMSHVLRSKLGVEYNFIWFIFIFYVSTKLCLLNALIAQMIALIIDRKAAMRLETGVPPAKKHEALVEIVQTSFEKEGLVFEGGLFDRTSLEEALEIPTLMQKLEDMGIFPDSIRELFDVMDEPAGTGILQLEEFLGALLRLSGEAKSKDMYVASIAVQQLYGRQDLVGDGIQKGKWLIHRCNLLMGKLEREMRDHNRRSRPSRPGIQDPDEKQPKKGPFHPPTFSAITPLGGNKVPGVNDHGPGERSVGYADTSVNVCNRNA